MDRDLSFRGASVETVDDRVRNRRRSAGSFRLDVRDQPTTESER
jgi:hypothetical protein